MLSGCLIALLCGMGSLVALQCAHDDLAPPSAVDVRVDSSELTRIHITYHSPPDWLLLDMYAYLEGHGWARDSYTERMTHYDGIASPAGAFAIFTRRSWFGLAHEVMTVGIAPYDHPRVQVRQLSCFEIPPWTGCRRR